MGYTHYYYISKEFDAKKFAKVAADFKKMVTPLKHLGVVLADGHGKNYPTISPTEIRFNGLTKCGHTKRDLGITWPSETASGISANKVDCQLQELTKSKWFAGAKLESRVCGGDCSHETFSLSQMLETTMTRYDGSTYELEPQGEFVGYTNQDGTRNKNPKNEVGKYFAFTKTAYKPYDLAVTVCLVIAKHHLREQIVIDSDGTMKNWYEAMQLCHHFLGYGRGFCLDDDKSVPLDVTDASAMISTYNKNKKEIASLRETQEKLKDEKSEQIDEIKDRYGKTISELNDQQYIETRKLRDEINKSEDEMTSKIDELSSPIGQTDRIIYYLRQNQKTPDTRYCDSVKSRRDEHVELLEKYSDECISLQMYLVENGRPTNKYSLIIVGDSTLGARDRNEAILQLPYEYLGWRSRFDCSYNNIQVPARHFKTIQDAKKYHSKNNIRTILKKFFVQYDAVKTEYDETNKKYTIDYFEELFRKQFSDYWANHCYYKESERKETAEKLGINTIDVSEMSFDQVLKIAEKYGQ